MDFENLVVSCFKNMGINRSIDMINTVIAELDKNPRDVLVGLAEALEKESLKLKICPTCGEDIIKINHIDGDVVYKCPCCNFYQRK